MTILVRSCSGQSVLSARTVVKSCHLAASLAHSTARQKGSSDRVEYGRVRLHGTIHLTRACETFAREPRTHLFSIIIICLPFSFSSVRRWYSVSTATMIRGHVFGQQQSRATGVRGGTINDRFSPRFRSIPILSLCTDLYSPSPGTGLITLARCIRYLRGRGKFRKHGETCTISRARVSVSSRVFVADLSPYPDKRERHGL